MSTPRVSHDLPTSTGPEHLPPLTDTAVHGVGKLALLRIQILEEV